jgi:hypothetical protein
LIPLLYLLITNASTEYSTNADTKTANTRTVAAGSTFDDITADADYSTNVDL